MNVNEEEVEDGVFEEIVEREVILESDLSEKDRENIAASETNEISAEDAAAFAAELEAAQRDVNVVAAPDKRQLTQEEMIKAIKRATKEGILTSSKKRRLMQEMGIFQADFTKKHESKTSKINKRKAAKKARRKNRK